MRLILLLSLLIITSSEITEAPSHMIELDEKSFQDQVIDSDELWLVDFYSVGFKFHDKLTLSGSILISLLQASLLTV